MGRNAPLTVDFGQRAPPELQENAPKKLLHKSDWSIFLTPPLIRDRLTISLTLRSFFEIDNCERSVSGLVSRTAATAQGFSQKILRHQS